MVAAAGEDDAVVAAAWVDTVAAVWAHLDKEADRSVRVYSPSAVAASRYTVVAACYPCRSFVLSFWLSFALSRTLSLSLDCSISLSLALSLQL